MNAIVPANFIGKCPRLSDTDLPRIGYKIGVGEDEIHAFLDVEASGSGYDKGGRPKMLFEYHKFYKHVRSDKRAQAVAQKLACVNWGDIPYPLDSYPVLQKAMLLDPEAALLSASWGIAQVMGENFVAAGYDTVFAMVQAYIDLGEAEQLESAVRFIKYNHLDDELRAHNWAAFARGYNGSAYAKNKYDVKLATAFAKWRRIRDTSWSPVAEPPPITETMRTALNTPPANAVPIEVARPPVTLPPPSPKLEVPPAPPPVTATAKPAMSAWQRFLAGLQGKAT